MLGPWARHKHWLLFLLYPLVGLGFSACEALVPRVVHAMEWQPLDGWIPFVPWMVWPYVAWYLTVAGAMVWTAVHDAAEFKRLAAFLYLGMTSAYLVYLVYPNGQNLRPALDTLGTGWEFDILRWIYTNDTPTNCNPSIHVIDAMAVWIALGRDKILGRKVLFQGALAVVSVSIIASTVLVKQHSALDLFGGLVWSAIWYVLIYRPVGNRIRAFFRFRLT